MRSARDVNAEAAAWLVRNDKHAPNPEKLAGFESWLAADPRHRAAYLRLRFAWRRANLFRRMGSHDQTVDLDPLAPQSSLRGLRSAPGWGFAALAVTLLALAGAAAWMLQAPDWERLATQLGALDQVALADGSTIHLNSDSEVAVRLGNARRDIVLVRGEAYFAVAPDPRRPFEVEAEGAILRALGTAFSVRVRALHRVDVLVESGIVSIAQAGDRRTTLHTLFAGHTATIERGRITARRLEPHEVKRRLMWTEGRIWFDGATLAEAVSELNRYNHRQLRIADPAIASERLFGSFQTTDVDSFVRALERSHRVRAKQVPADDGMGGEILLAGAASDPLNKK